MKIPNPNNKTVTLPLSEYLDLLETTAVEETEIWMQVLNDILTDKLIIASLVGSPSDFSRIRDMITKILQDKGYIIVYHPVTGRVYLSKDKKDEENF